MYVGVRERTPKKKEREGRGFKKRKGGKRDLNYLQLRMEGEKGVLGVFKTRNNMSSQFPDLGWGLRVCG